MQPPEHTAPGAGATHRVTELLGGVAAGDSGAANELLEIVYGHLRKIAARRMAGERPGHTLGATELVHEAYLKMAGSLGERDWKTRGHFYAAAAEAMRRILVDHARRRLSAKRGGGAERDFIDVIELAAEGDSEAVLALHEAVDRLEAAHPAAAAVVKLRFFAGLSVIETGESLGISERSTVRHWRFARAWLYDKLSRGAAL